MRHFHRRHYAFGSRGGCFLRDGGRLLRLAIDIGNTKTALGLYEDGQAVRSWRISTQHWTPDELGAILYVLLADSGLPRPGMVCYACVVPQVRHSVEGMSRGFLGVAPMEVTSSSAGIALRYPKPEELGGDRIANSVAAIARGSLPAIVADFGTATTFDVIDSGGAYLGGSIAPGVGTAAAELFRKAEKLSPVDLDFPGNPLGLSTADAIRSGVLLGAAGAADRLVELLGACVGGSPALLATGGWASGIAPHCRSRFTVVPDLTLSGIDEVGRRNEGRPDLHV